MSQQCLEQGLIQLLRICCEYSPWSPPNIQQTGQSQCWTCGLKGEWHGTQEVHRAATWTVEGHKLYYLSSSYDH